VDPWAVAMRAESDRILPAYGHWFRHRVRASFARALPLACGDFRVLVASYVLLDLNHALSDHESLPGVLTGWPRFPQTRWEPWSTFR
jgi:hypothetical protein